MKSGEVSILDLKDLSEGQLFLANDKVGEASTGPYPLIFRDLPIEGFDPYTGKDTSFIIKAIPNPKGQDIIQDNRVLRSMYRRRVIEEARDKGEGVIIFREAIPYNDVPTSRLRTVVKTVSKNLPPDLSVEDLYIVKAHSDINPHSVVIVMVGGKDNIMWLVKDYESGEIFPIRQRFLRNISEAEGKVISRGAYKLLNSMFGDGGPFSKKKGKKGGK
jgi:hypothetical protein